MLFCGEQLDQRRLQRDVALVVYVLGALGLEAVLVVVEVDEVALAQRGLVLEEVLHLERHLAATPARRMLCYEDDYMQGSDVVRTCALKLGGATDYADNKHKSRTCSWSSLCRPPSCRRRTSGCSGTGTQLQGVRK